MHRNCRIYRSLYRFNSSPLDSRFHGSDSSYGVIPAQAGIQAYGTRRRAILQKRAAKCFLPALYQLDVYTASDHRRRPLQAAERNIVLWVE